MIIYPAMDLMDGKCVRLYQGNPESQDVFDLSPVSWAIACEAAGAKRLHMIDLDGAFTGRPEHMAILEAVRASVALPIQIGGGIRSEAQAEALIQSGFDVILGTLLIQDPAAARRLAQAYPKQMLASVDCLEGWATQQGWQTQGRIRGLDLIKRLLQDGFQRIVYTDICTDGTLKGPNLSELSAILALKSSADFELIASGGVGSLADLKALRALGADGAIVGRALLSGCFSLKEALHAD